MVRGTVVKAINMEYYKYLSDKDGIATVAVIEKVMDEIQQEEVAKCVRLTHIPLADLLEVETYPSYLKQINFT